MKLIIATNYKSLSLYCLLATSSIFSGCSKFLDKQPFDVVKENYYQNEKEVMTGLVGVYDILGREDFYGSTYSTFLTVGDEGAYFRSSYLAGPEIYSYDASNPKINDIWRFLYEGIERANFFLSKIDAVQMNNTEKQAVIGEVRFLRAYYYFILVSNWGAVPLKTEPTKSVSNVNIARTAAVEVYNFVVQEMEAAESMVKDIQTYAHAGRISKSAARGLLARVYLKMAGAPLNDASKYQKALEWSSKLVFPEAGEYKHSLVTDYKKIFTDMAADRYNISESIWEVEFYGNRTGDFEAGRIGNQTGIQTSDEGKGFSYGLLAATRKLFESYEPTDQRRDWNIASYRYNHANNLITDSVFYTGVEIERRHVAKFRRDYETLKPKNRNYTPINFPLLRYADVLLMFAEAENEVNGPTARAKEALQQVRDRAKASNRNQQIGNESEMRTAIREERFRELCYEGLRKFDLVRYGTFVAEMKLVAQQYAQLAPADYRYLALAFNNVSERDMYFPVPINELSLNNLMTQNPGW